MAISNGIRAVLVGIGSTALAIGTVAAVGQATSDDSTSAEVQQPAASTETEAQTANSSADSTEHDMADMEHGAGHDMEHGAGHDMADMEHGAGHDSASKPAGGTEAEGHAHGGPHGESEASYADLAPKTQGEVDIVRKIARKYPTAAEALTDGWAKATYSLEGIGSHYLKGGVGGFATDSEFDINQPEILLFDGEGTDAKLAGISYLASGEDPEGFTGDDDVWHRHEGVCFKGLVIAEIDGHEGSTISMSAAQCKAAGGINFPIGNLTMLHVWVGKGYEASAPTFAHDHPKLYHGTPVGEPASF